MYTIPYANGQTLNSSVLSPTDIMTIMQMVTLESLGIVVDATDPEVAYKQVRIGWQPDGAPAWKKTEDVCVITAYLERVPYTLVRDQLFSSNDNASFVQQMSYTRVWRIHWMFQGPNCYTRASAVITAMQLDWVRQFLQSPPPPYVSKVYLIPVFIPPVYIPEDFQARWWNRTDIDLKFNELVLETITVPSAAILDFEVITDTGIVEKGSAPA